jgi:hypothetical protein
MCNSLGATRAVLVPLAALMACGSALAQVDVGQPIHGQPVTIYHDSAYGRVTSFEYQGRFAYVRIETREPGAPLNEHPLTIDAAGVRALLSRVQLQGKKPEPLLAKEELDEICAPLAAALGKATPEQDVSFASSATHGVGGLLASHEVTAARVFRRDGRLQVIFGLIREDFENRFRGTGELIAFEPGQRAKVVDAGSRIGVPADAGSDLRSDWVALNLPPAVLQAGGTAPAPATAAAGAPAVTPTVAPGMAPPAPVAAPPAPAAAPQAAPSSPPAAAPAVRDAETIYRNLSERLKALQKLRDAGLITPQEYEERRRQLLQEL